MAEPRDTVLDIEPPAAEDWDKPTPRVVVVPPDERMGGVLEALNALYKFLQTDEWKIRTQDGGARLLTKGEAAAIVQTLKDRMAAEKRG